MTPRSLLRHISNFVETKYYQYARIMSSAGRYLCVSLNFKE